MWRCSGLRACGAALALCLLLAGAADAVIEFAHVTRDDRSIIPVAQPFGYGSKGHATLTLRDVALYRRHDQDDTGLDLNNFGFILTSDERQLDAHLRSGNCPLSDAELRLFTFADKQVQQVVARGLDQVKFDVDVRSGGQAFIHFVNCAAGMPVSFALRVEQFNLVGADGHKDYLPIGESELDVMYWIMFGLFTAIGGAWLYVLLSSERESVHAIHWLMAALVAFKALTLFGQAAMFYVIEHQGTPHGWNWVYYTFTCLRGLLFFTVVVLIGTGWSFMHSHMFIDERTRQVLLLVVPLQVLANLAIIITSEENPAFNDWLTWQDIFHIVDIVCCCAVLFPIVWSIRKLREASETDGKAARSLARLTVFRQFYILVVVFIWTTRIGVFLLENTIDYRYKWTAAAVNELAVLAFYVTVGTRFRPGSASSPYAALASSSDDGSA